MKRALPLAAGMALLLTACGGAGGNDSASAKPAGPTATVPAPGGGDWTTQIAMTPEGGVRMGNPNAPVKLVEFASMTCHVCRDFAAESAGALEDKYIKTGQVSFEFRNFVRDQFDIVGSLLARCGGPAPFFKISEQMFAEQDATLAKAQAIPASEMAAMNGLPPTQQFARLAAATGLDKFVGMRGIPASKAQACLADETEVNRLVAMRDAASKTYQVQGTPTFLINGKVVPETVSWAQVEQRIQAALR